MPVVLRSPSHRQKLNYPSSHDGIALVARSVSIKEVATNPKAKAADDAEWNDLRRMQTWDESTVMEWSDVKQRAKTEQRRVHVGRVFGILVEKGSELKESDPRRKYKARGSISRFRCQG